MHVQPSPLGGLGTLRRVAKGMRYPHTQIETSGCLLSFPTIAFGGPHNLPTFTSIGLPHLPCGGGGFAFGEACVALVEYKLLGAPPPNWGARRVVQSLAIGLVMMGQPK